MLLGEIPRDGLIINIYRLETKTYLIHNFMARTKIREAFGQYNSEQDLVYQQQNHLLSNIRSKAPGMWSSNVFELSRNFTSVVFLALNTLAEQASNCDIKIEERLLDGYKELNWTEPVSQFLEKPNPLDSFGDIIYQIIQQGGLTGTTLIWMPKINNAIPQEMYVMPTALMLPQPRSDQFPNGYYLYQQYGVNGMVYQNSSGTLISADDIIRIKYQQHPLLRWEGYSVLSALAPELDTLFAMNVARRQTQLTEMDPKFALEFDSKLIDPKSIDLKRYRESIQAVYGGPLGDKLPSLPLGVSLKKIKDQPNEMDWLGGMNQLWSFCMASFGVPKSVAGLQEDVNYATLYASLKQFYIGKLNPLLAKIARHYNREIVHPYYGKELFLRLEGKEITDEEMLYKKIQVAGEFALIRRNEARKALGFDKVEGPDGEEFISKLTQRVSEQGGTFNQQTGEANRPTNSQGQGSQPARKSLKERGDWLEGILDNHKVRGDVFSANGH